MLEQEVTGEGEPQQKAMAAAGGLFGRAKRTAQVGHLSAHTAAMAHHS